MSIAFAEKMPEELLRRLYESDRHSQGRSQLPPATGEQARAWLRRTLVEFDSLDEHIALLQKLYGSSFQYPRPRRDRGRLPQPAEASADSTFAHAELLNDETVTSILDAGIDTLPDDELARLLLNPYALFDLFDCIDDVQPDYWIDAIHDFVTVHRDSRQKPTQIAAGNGRSDPLLPPLTVSEPRSNGSSAELQRTLDVALTLSTQLNEILDRQRAMRWTNNWRYPLALAAAVTFFMVGLAFFLNSRYRLDAELVADQRTELKRLTEQIERSRDEFNQLAQRAGNQNLLVPTNNAQNRPINWTILLEEIYDPKLPDDDNLKSLELRGGDAVRQRIAQLRQRTPMPSSREMLNDLFRTWGGPTLPQE